MTVDFFFYGSLRDAGVRRIVLGPGALAGPAEPATLADYRCAPVEQGRYPAVVEQRGAIAPGVLVHRVSLDAAARVSYFEDDGACYDAPLRPVSVARGRSAVAWVFVATAALPVEAGIWQFETWQRRWRPAFLAGAKAAMTCATPAGFSRYRRIWLDRLDPAPGSRSPCS